MAVIAAGNRLRQLTFGHGSARAAVQALDPKLRASTALNRNPALARQLRRYAAGRPVDFRRLMVDLKPLTPFQRRVVAVCRRIPCGKTLSYGELAARAGAPGAARAVGNCMARNRIPLVIPCHRVVAAGGRIGAYSAPGGAAMKRRLLAMEAAAVGRNRRRQRPGGPGTIG
jgi:methylated-DNA-[protein]-cysteine S-methyltransferase